jgi:hypothetical protein
MHYRGLLRVARRQDGIRIYTAHQHELGPADAAERRARVDTLVDLVVRIYAPKKVRRRRTPEDTVRLLTPFDAVVAGPRPLRAVVGLGVPF